MDETKLGVLAALLVACALGAEGCAGRSSGPPATTAAGTAAPEDDVAAALMEHHRYHHHGGVMLFIAMSLDTLAVAPEERAAAEGIQKELLLSLDPARVAEQSLLSALADGVAAGAIDASKVDADVAQVAAAARTVHGENADALDRLHKALSPAERAALVDKVDAHWAVWKRVNGLENGAASTEQNHLAATAAELDLTSDQGDRIRAALDESMKGVEPLDPKEIDAELHTFGDAFRAPTFDSKGVMQATDADAHMVSWAAAHLSHFVQALNPVLTPEQRTTLADRLRVHAAHGPTAEAAQ